MYKHTAKPINVYRASYKKAQVPDYLGWSIVCIGITTVSSFAFGIYWKEPIFLLTSILLVGLIFLLCLGRQKGGST